MLAYCVSLRKISTSSFKWMYKAVNLWKKNSWYNTIICTKLNGKIFKYSSKTGRKDSYELMYDVDLYDKDHVTMPDDEISSGGRPIPSTSSKE